MSTRYLEKIPATAKMMTRMMTIDMGALEPPTFAAMMFPLLNMVGYRAGTQPVNWPLWYLVTIRLCEYNSFVAGMSDHGRQMPLIHTA